MASADGRTLIWNVRTSAQLVELAGHVADVTSVAFAPGDRMIATGGLGGAAFVYDTAFLTPENSLCLSPKAC